jgi:uncharacterized protein (TIGR04168 family)
MGKGVETGSVEILVIGDLHGQFDAVDRNFLETRHPLLSLFVGDLGDEDPEMVDKVLEAKIPTFGLLGNHDAWKSFREDRVTNALASCLTKLGNRHLAYRRIDLPSLDISIIGARPFSWGGPKLRSKAVYKALYGIDSMQESAEKIVEAAREAPGKRIWILAHNGPLGLSKASTDIFGKDFGNPGGDWGDADLRLAMDLLEEEGFEIPLLIAGHMHHRCQKPRGAIRKKSAWMFDTLVLNTARVPRIFQERGKPKKTHHCFSIRANARGITGISELLFDGVSVREEQINFENPHETVF